MVVPDNAGLTDFEHPVSSYFSPGRTRGVVLDQFVTPAALRPGRAWRDIGFVVPRHGGTTAKVGHRLVPSGKLAVLLGVKLVFYDKHGGGPSPKDYVSPSRKRAVTKSLLSDQNGEILAPQLQVRPPRAQAIGPLQ
jgi:hypothetical protein